MNTLDFISLVTEKRACINPSRIVGKFFRHGGLM